MNNKDHSYSLTRGLGALFIFASFLFLENDLFLWVIISLVAGVINMLPYPWFKRWTSLALYGINMLLTGVIFYKFIQLETRYLQWLWLAVFVYYTIRFRDLWKENDKKEIPPVQLTDESKELD